MKKIKKSVAALGVTSVLCVGAVGYAVSVQQQLMASQQERSELEKQLAQNQEELEKTKLEKFEEVAKQIRENKPKTVVGEVFENGYLKKHGDHYHFVYGKPPVDAIYEEKQNSSSTMGTTDDGYVFNQQDIVEENELGYVVRHGDHYHFVYKNQTAQAGGSSNSNEIEEEEPFVFDRKNIVSEDDKGYVVRHGDHTHYVYKKDLAEAPLVENPDATENEHQKCRLLRIPHGDHFHDVLDCSGGKDDYHFDDSPVTKPESTPHEVPENPTISIPSTSNELPKEELTIHSPEIQKYLDYIVYAYGVERDTIRLQPVYNDNGQFAGNVFAFQNMEQGQDKSHIHPWIIPLRNFQLPNEDPTIDAEIRFADELALVAKRMGIPTTAIRIIGDRFEVPHGDHSHSLRIKNIAGIQPYLANKIKGISSSYIPGELDEAIVIQKINALREKAGQTFIEQPVIQKRILVALQEIQERLVEKGNSTNGYLKMLERFEKQYIDQQEVDVTEDSSLQSLNAQHDAIMKTISELNLEGYGITTQELRDMANQAIEHKNETELNEVQEYVQALRAANDRPGVEGMKYLYFFTQHLLDEALSSQLREQVAQLITRISTSTIIVGEEEDAEPLFAPSYLAKKAIRDAHAKFNGTVDREIGEHLQSVLTPEDEDSRSTYESMKEFANEVLEEDQKDKSLPVSDFREAE